VAVASARIRKVQRTALALLVISGMVNFIDRGTLAIANPLIRHDLGLSIGQMGLLLSSFLLAYSFGQLPIGGIVDRYGPRRVLTGGITLWSIAQVFGGLATGFGTFVAARLLLGIGESPQFMSCVRVVRDWFNLRDRGLSNGILGGASSMGLAVAAPLLTWLMLSFGWRSMFVIMGIAGLIIAAIWFATYRDVATVPLTDDERAYLVDGEPAEPHRKITLHDWLQLFRFGTTWGVVLGFVGTVYVSTVYMTWLPAYLELDRHVSIFKTGFMAGIPFLFGIVGSASGGLLVDVLVRRGVAPLTSCKVPVVGGLLGAVAFTALVPAIGDNSLAIACISAAVFMGYMSTGAAWSLVSVVAPKNYVGSLAGMKNFGGYFGGAFAPAITGYIAEATHSFQLALLLGAAVGLLGALIYLFAVRRSISEIELLTRPAA